MKWSSSSSQGGGASGPGSEDVASGDHGASEPGSPPHEAPDGGRPDHSAGRWRKAEPRADCSESNTGWRPSRSGHSLPTRSSPGCPGVMPISSAFARRAAPSTRSPPIRRQVTASGLPSGARVFHHRSDHHKPAPRNPCHDITRRGTTQRTADLMGPSSGGRARSPAFARSAPSGTFAERHAPRWSFTGHRSLGTPLAIQCPARSGVQLEGHSARMVMGSA